MENKTPLDKKNLQFFFLENMKPAEKIGIEIELATMSLSTGQSTSYNGKRGLRQLLSTLRDTLKAKPIYDASNLIGLSLPSGATYTLEHGGALEFSSAPASDLTELMLEVSNQLKHVADIASRHDIALVPGGNLPFEHFDKIAWMPLQRGEHMRKHFANIGRRGNDGHLAMALTLSLQVNLDYASETDFYEKSKLINMVAPFAGVLFANSPIEQGAKSRYLSSRMIYWTTHDSERCGSIGHLFEEGFSLSNYVEWFLTFPMIFRKVGRRYITDDFTNFGTALKEGFANGTRPTISDWRSHLSQFWYFSRIREHIEIRVSDGQMYNHISSVPAFWVGLLYDKATRDRALDYLKMLNLNELNKLWVDGAEYGFKAGYREQSFHAICRELLHLAKKGLQARVTKGYESDKVLDFLKPLEDRISRKSTAAEDVYSAWHNNLQQNRLAFVKHFKIP